MQGRDNRFKLILFCMTFMLCFRAVTATDITYVLRTEGGDAIVNVTVSVYNETWELVGSNNTNDIGNASFILENSTTFYIYGVIPSSNYHAVLSNVSLPESIFLNDVLGGSVRLINTLGQSLEAQDCSVVTIDNETGTLIKDYHTLCSPGEVVIDPTTGNYMSLLKCPITDSNGNYYFNTVITEGDGYQQGRYYRLQITCNGKVSYGIFYVDVPKPMDVDMWIEWFIRYLGVPVFYTIIFVIALVAIKAGYDRLRGND